MEMQPSTAKSADCCGECEWAFRFVRLFKFFKPIIMLKNERSIKSSKNSLCDRLLVRFGLVAWVLMNISCFSVCVYATTSGPCSPTIRCATSSPSCRQMSAATTRRRSATPTRSPERRTRKEWGNKNSFCVSQNNWQIIIKHLGM